MRNIPLAEEHLIKALTLIRITYGPESNYYKETLYNLSEIVYSRGEWRVAYKLYKEAIEGGDIKGIV